MIADQGVALIGKVLSLTLIAASVTTPGINDISIPLVGVPLTAITMSAAGAACSFAWPQNQRKITRGRLFFIAIVSTVAGASAVSVIPEMVGHPWPKELQPPLAFFFGLIAPWALPAIKTVIPTFFRGLGAVLVRMVTGKTPPSEND